MHFFHIFLKTALVKTRTGSSCMLSESIAHFILMLGSYKECFPVETELQIFAAAMLRGQFLAEMVLKACQLNSFHSTLSERATCQVEPRQQKYLRVSNIAASPVNQINTWY